MATEKFANSASSTLNGAIDNSVTSLTVTSAASFPSAAQFRIKIETEILLVTNVSGAVFTVTRGVEGTTAASHGNGVAVDHIVTAASLTKGIGDFAVVDTYTNRPAAGTPGRMFHPSDGFTSFIDDGTSWRPLIQGVPGVQPDAASGFTAVNMSASSALADNNGTLVASDDTQNNSLPNYRVWHKSLSSNTVVEAAFWHTPTFTTWNSTSLNYTFGGILLRESSSSKLALLMTTINPSNGIPLVSSEYATSATTSRTIVGSESEKRFLPTYGSPQLYFRLRVDGSNIRYEYSTGRTQWTNIASIAKTTAFTTAPDQYGVVVWTYNNNNPSSSRIIIPHLTTY